MTLSNHEPRSQWRWGSTRNRRINIFPATVAHQFMSSPSSPLGLQVDFPHLYEWESATSVSMWTKLDALPLSQILQVHVMQCRQWALTGRNINLHLWHGGRNKTLSEPQCGAEVCLPRIYIWNNERKRRDVNGYFFVWGSVFMMRGV